VFFRLLFLNREVHKTISASGEAGYVTNNKNNKNKENIMSIEAFEPGDEICPPWWPHIIWDGHFNLPPGINVPSPVNKIR
jgi:hypothetical protein